DQIVEEPERQGVSPQRRQLQWLGAVRPLIGSKQLHEDAALLVAPCGRRSMEAGPGDERPNPLQRLGQRRIETIAERNRDRMKRRDIDVLGRGTGLGDLDSQESGVAPKRMGADEDAAEPED